RFGHDLYMTAHALNVASNHVHADPPTGNLGDLFGGREAGREDQRPDCFVGRVLVHGEALLHGLLENLVAVQTRAVVPDLDNDLAAVMLRRHGDRAFGILADFCTTLGRLDTVVDTVAHQVCEGVDEAFDQALVEFSGGALRDQSDAFTHLARRFANDAREPADHVIHRYPADRHD